MRSLDQTDTMPGAQGNAYPFLELFGQAEVVKMASSQLLGLVWAQHPFVDPSRARQSGQRRVGPDSLQVGSAVGGSWWLIGEDGRGEKRRQREGGESVSPR